MLVVEPSHWGQGGWKRPVEAQSLGSCSEPGMVGCAGKAGAFVRHELPMVNGELGVPEMSMLRCPVNNCLNLAQMLCHSSIGITDSYFPLVVGWDTVPGLSW